jgi:hypothetical protein
LRHQLGVPYLNGTAQQIVCEFLEILREPHQVVIDGIAALPSEPSDSFGALTVVRGVLHARLTTAAIQNPALDVEGGESFLGDTMALPQEENTIAFLKLAAIELRNIARDAPDIADRIRQIVEKLEAETADLERRYAVRVPDRNTRQTGSVA